MEAIRTKFRVGAARLRQAARPSLRAMESSSESIYLFILALFLAEMYICRYSYVQTALPAVHYVFAIVNSAIRVTTALYAFYTLVRMVLAQPSALRRLAAFAAVALPAAAVGFLVLRRSDMEQNRFHALWSLFMVVFAAGKDFRKIARTFLVMYCLILLGAALGLLLGYTYDNTKYSTYGVKLSLGMIHPNTFGHVAMGALLMIWTLWLQKKPVACFALFWGAAIPLAIFVRCRTAVALMAVFPPLTLLMRWVAERRSRGLLARGLTLSPWLFFGLTLLLCGQMALLQRTYGTFLANSSERFVQGGIALEVYGLPLLGRNIDTSGSILAVINGKNVSLTVMDNAFVSYGIILGSLWLVSTLLWLSLANVKALRRGDAAILAISLIMLVFAMMERRGLDAGYNIVLLYPLARGGSVGEDGHV